MAQGTGHYVSRKDGRVYYDQRGNGEPLIFMHAVGLSGWSWRKVIDSFAEHFTCYNIDLPGYDHSDVPARQYSIEDFTDAVVDVMNNAGIAQTKIVGDHSGAMMAVDLARRYPQRVERMVLDGMPYWNKESGRAFFEKNFRPQHTDTTSYDIPVSPMWTYEEALVHYPSWDKELWAKREEIKSKSRLWVRLSQDANTGYDMQEAGPKVKAPTLLIYGAGDLKRFDGERANEGIKGSTLKIFSESPGGAHDIMPKEFTRTALEFLLEGRQ